MPHRESHQPGNVPKGVGGNFPQDPAGGTTTVDHKGDTTKIGYLTFDPGGL